MNMNDKLPKVKDILQKAIADKVFPGCSLAMVDENSTQIINLGKFTYEADAKDVDDSTIYDTASLTKIVTVMSIAMMLVDEGILNLDEKVSKYLKEFESSSEKKNTTIAHLMTYTLDYDIPGGAKSLMNGVTPEELSDTMLNLQLKSEAGSSYMYSNITAFILTQIIERVTSRKFEDLVNEKIIIPIQMKSTSLTLSMLDINNIVPTEFDESGELVCGYVHDESTYHLQKGGISSGAAGLFSTTTDLANFLKMVIGGGTFEGKRIFSEKNVSLWTKDYFPDLLPTHTPLGWGDLSNELIDFYHRDIVVKAGFTGCFMAADLKNKVGFVLLSNRIYPKRPDDASAFARLKRELMDGVLG